MAIDLEAIEAEQWTVAGPLRNVDYAILRAPDGECIFTIKSATNASSLARAFIASRALIMRAKLKHIKAELEGDDEGARHQDLIKMIDDELNAAPPPMPAAMRTAITGGM